MSESTERKALVSAFYELNSHIEEELTNVPPHIVAQFVVGRMSLKRLRRMDIGYYWPDKVPAEYADESGKKVARLIASVVMGYHNVQRLESIGLVLVWKGA